jgi:hypothetical protein
MSDNSKTNDTESLSDAGTISTGQSLSTDEFLNALKNQDAIGEAVTPIIGSGCVVVSANSGIRYLYWDDDSVIWVRPDGIPEVTSQQKTRQKLTEFNSLKLIPKTELPNRVRTALARQLND